MPGWAPRMNDPPAMPAPPSPSVLVACPDARPPAYQAVVGLARAGALHSFVTAYYYRGDGAIASLGRRLAPGRVERVLRRRHDPEIPADRVRSAWSYDVALRLADPPAGRRGPPPPPGPPGGA